MYTTIIFRRIVNKKDEEFRQTSLYNMESQDVNSEFNDPYLSCREALTYDLEGIYDIIIRDSSYKSSTYELELRISIPEIKISFEIFVKKLQKLLIYYTGITDANIELGEELIIKTTPSIFSGVFNPLGFSVVVLLLQDHMDLFGFSILTKRNILKKLLVNYNFERWYGSELELIFTALYAGIARSEKDYSREIPILRYYHHLHNFSGPASFLMGLFPPEELICDIFTIVNAFKNQINDLFDSGNDNSNSEYVDAFRYLLFGNYFSQEIRESNTNILEEVMWDEEKM